MWALPQRYEKATAMLWKHDRYRNANRNANVYRYKVMLANVSGNGCGSVICNGTGNATVIFL